MITCCQTGSITAGTPWRASPPWRLGSGNDALDVDLCRSDDSMEDWEFVEKPSSPGPNPPVLSSDHANNCETSHPIDSPESCVPVSVPPNNIGSLKLGLPSYVESTRPAGSDCGSSADLYGSAVFSASEHVSSNGTSPANSICHHPIDTAIHGPERVEAEGFISTVARLKYPPMISLRTPIMRNIDQHHGIIDKFAVLGTPGHTLVIPTKVNISGGYQCGCTVDLAMRETAMSNACTEGELTGENSKESVDFGDEDMDDELLQGEPFWEWDPSTCQYRHWDPDDQQYIYCPEDFD